MPPAPRTRRGDRRPARGSRRGSGSGASRRTPAAGAASGSACPPVERRGRPPQRARARSRGRRAPAAARRRPVRPAASARRRRARAPRAAPGSREAALELPGMEEELPVDEADEVRQRRLDGARAREVGLGQVVERNRLAVRSGGGERQQRLADASRRAGCAAAPAPRGSRGRARGAEPGSVSPETTPITRDASSTCTVSLPYSGRDLHRRVLLRRRRAADEQRQLQAAALHLGGDVRPSRRARA